MGATTKVGDQKPLANQWLNLGEYQFSKGTSGNVQLTDLNGETNLSRFVSFSAMRFTLLTPYVPTNVSASDGTYTDKVQVSWSSASGATNYEVFRATSPSGSKTKIGSPSSTSFADTSAVSGQEYYYWVRACNTGGCSDFSTSDSGYSRVLPPSIPTNVSASDGTYTDMVVVSWNSVSGATSYEIYRDTYNLLAPK